MARYRRRRRRRRNPRRRPNNTKMKRVMIGAAVGAVTGALLVAGAGAARGLPSAEFMPKNAMVGAVMGALAGMLAPDTRKAAIYGALTAGTGIYVFNIARAAATPPTEPAVAGLGMMLPGPMTGLAGYVNPMHQAVAGEYVREGVLLR